MNRSRAASSRTGSSGALVTPARIDAVVCYCRTGAALAAAGITCHGIVAVCTV